MEKRKKYGGRKKGTPNKTTTDMRAAAANLLREYQESGLMNEDWGKLEPKERLMMAEKFMQYTVPKLQSIEMTGEMEHAVTIEDKLIALSKEQE